MSTGWGYFYHYNPRGCPAGTSYEWAYQTQHSASGWSSWSGWMGAGSQGGFDSRSGDTPYGESLRGGATMRCVSNFTQGPQVQSYTGWSGARPWPAPSAPSSTWFSGSVYRWCGNNGWSGANFRWSEGSYASYYSVTASWNNSFGGRSSQGFGTTSSTSMGLSASGSVSSTLAVYATVTSYNSAGSSGSVGAYASQGGGCVAG